MKRKFLFYVFFLFSVVFSLTTCDDNDKISPDLIAEYTLDISPKAIGLFDAEGGTKSITVEAKKIVKSYFNETHDSEKDIVRNADFIVSIEGDSSFELETQENGIIVTAPANETENVRVANMIISLKRKPEIKTVIKLRQGVYKHSGDEYYEFDIDVSPSELTIFDIEGGSQDIEVAASKKLMKYQDGEYQVHNENVASFTTSIDSDYFSSSISGNTVTVIASNNTGVERTGNLKIVLTENTEQFVVIQLKQKSLLLSPFPTDHVFARLAEFNVGLIPNQFAENHQNDATGYYNWDDAISACPDGWHLPSVAEINVFVPPHAEYIGYGGTGIAYRIIGGAGNRTAYCYEKIGVFSDNGNLDARLKITGRYLGSSDISEETISNKSWWENYNENDLYYFFPVNGRIADTGDIQHRGIRGHYWSKTQNENDINTAHFLSIWSSDAYTNMHMKSIGGAVRCIKDM